jgi:hypothetical protein
MKEIIKWIHKLDKKEAEIIATELEEETIQVINAPPPPTGAEDPNNPGQFLPANALGIQIHEQEILLIAKRRANLCEERPWAYAILKGQCSSSTWGKISAEAGFEAINNAKDAIFIKAICCGFEAHKQKVYTVAQAVVLLMTTMQDQNESVDTYYRNFDTRWSMLEQFGRSLGGQPGLIAEQATEIAEADGRENANEDDITAAEKIVSQEMNAMLMLCMANKTRFEPLQDALVIKYFLGVDNYPTTCKQLMGVMQNFKAPKHNQPRVHQDHDKDKDEGLEFIQKQAEGEDETEEGATLMQRRKSSRKARERRTATIAEQMTTGRRIARSRRRKRRTEQRKGACSSKQPVQ